MKSINIKEINKIAKTAGKEVLEIHDGSFSIQNKEDSSGVKSPLTEADLASNKIIVDDLKKLYPDIPILSEESKEIPYEKRKNWNRFWLIDPLDGTKEFIKKNGEFTINIALIQDNKPVLGVVYVPVKDKLYYSDGQDAFKQVGNSEPIKLKPEENSTDKLRVVASKSHFTPETKEFIETLKKDTEKDIELINKGSSLKLCWVAEGKADIYPRLGPTMEWDTAAAHAVVNRSGKKIYIYDKEQKKTMQKELTYNKKNLRNPYFIVK